MKHPIRSFVQVIAPTDDTMDCNYIGAAGIVESYNSNKATGNTKDDPLHVVLFDDGTREEFWFEELKSLYP